MNIIQTLRRLGQQSSWSKIFDKQSTQINLIKKLYIKHGLEINGGGACPEQYDVFKDGKVVAYYRLRHGEFTVTVPDVGGETILEMFPNGDGLFDSDERLVYLSTALKNVLKNLK